MTDRSVHLFNFHGVYPGRDDALLNAAQAMLAEDVDLSRGDLTPILWGQPITSGDEDIKALVDIHGASCRFKSWDYYTDAEYGRPDDHDLGMLYWIEQGQVVFSPLNSICSDVAIPLAAHSPITPLSLTDTDGGEGCETVGSLCYTNIYSDGSTYFNESQPSPATGIQELNIIDRITVTLPAAPAGVMYRRVYRTMAGGTTGTETVIAAGGEWVLVGEFPAAAGNYETQGLESVAEIMPSARWDIPPPSPTCVTFISHTNVLVVGSGNTVHISHPGQYHAFPHDRDITLHDNVVAVREYNGDIIVLTDGRPYLIYASREREGAAHYEVIAADEAYPCMSKASVSVGNSGVVWASTDGVFTVGRSRAGLTVQSLTSGLIQSDDWRKVDPSSVRGEVHNGAYYFTSDHPIVNSITGRGAHTWVLAYDETIYSNPTNIHLTSLSIQPSAWSRSRLDELYYAIDGSIYEFNPKNGTPENYNYICRDLVETGLTNYSAMKVVNDGDGELMIQLYREKGSVSTLLYSREINHSEPFRLPRTNLSVDHFIRVTGTARVRRIHIASSYADLAIRFDDTTFSHGNSRITSR